jgi:2-polyprenyl-3-methyl-5-hydroxy-6-metoxy-1,4-benzoquinol methylase
MRLIRPVRQKLRDLRQALFGYSAETVTKEEWETSYRLGNWKRLEGSDEVAHYGAIVGFCEFYSSRRILDVGCGHGVLQQKLLKTQYEYYFGMDISIQAIAEAKAKGAQNNTQFLVADVESHPLPKEKFDAVIFSECLNYMKYPQSMIEKYTNVIAPNGKMLISMYQCGRTEAAWRLIPSCVTMIQSAKITNELTNISWVVRVYEVKGDARIV